MLYTKYYRNRLIFHRVKQKGACFHQTVRTTICTRLRSML